jgi:hypothetical protein
MKTSASLLLGVALLTSAVGCHHCCLWPHCGSNYGGACPPANYCPPVGCNEAVPGVMPGAVYPQGAIYGAPGGIMQAQAAPHVHYTAYPQTAMGPLESLPTY